jgi:hypothetical protein
MSIKSLAALKMEKNFIAVYGKDLPPKPYETYSILELFGFVEREMKELKEAIEDNKNFSYHDIMEEIADVSNCLDYLFEAVLREDIT